MCESCPMLGFCTKIKQTSGFSQVAVVYSVFVSFVTQLSSPSNVCVEHGHTCAYTKLTFCLHHARHSCSVFTVLWFGSPFVKRFIFTRPYLDFG